MSIEELLPYIEKRPQMYFREKSVFFLEAFLGGYLLNENIREKRFKYDLTYNFGEWLRSKFNYKLELGWATIINEISQEENLNSVDVFFREYYLFKKENK